jgi:hypothetical protein
MAARTDGLRTGDQLPSGRYRIGAVRDTPAARVPGQEAS